MDLLRPEVKLLVVPRVPDALPEIDLVLVAERDALLLEARA
jgi:hypothetical protein